MGHLHRVPHGVDVRIARAHACVHEDRAADAQLEAGVAGEGGLGGDADGEHDEIGLDGTAALHERADRARRPLEAADVRIQPQVHARVAQGVVEQGGHVGVDDGQHMAPALDQGDVHAALAQVLGHLQADEPRAHHGGAARAGALDEVVDGEGVLHGAQGEQPVAVDARQVGDDRAGAGGEDELVVGLGVDLAAPDVAHGDGARRPVDRHGLVAHAHVDVEAGAEALRGLEGELRAVRDDVAHVVGQAAVGVAHVAGALEDDDLRALVQAAQAGGGRGPSGHAPDDDDLHDGSFLFRMMIRMMQVLSAPR